MDLLFSSLTPLLQAKAASVPCASSRWLRMEAAKGQRKGLDLELCFLNCLNIFESQAKELVLVLSMAGNANDNKSTP